MVCVTGQWSTGRTAAVKCTYEGSTHFTQLNHYGLCYHINTKIHFGLIIVISYQVFHMKKIVLIDLWLCKIEYEQGLTRRGKGRNLLWEGDGCRCDSWDICCLCMDPTFRHVQWPRTVNGWIFPIKLLPGGTITPLEASESKYECSSWFCTGFIP